MILKLLFNIYILVNSLFYEMLKWSYNEFLI
jgi:hypothetical protein